ncbi:xylulose 5-phosphate 3-epimerase [Craterilacuibacter sp. RT1T]|uniref:phosphoketolase family protein n=1 Tax=Craterilacuibacter sp. RT1T TaxID=2942211 RepID=UPI0020C0912C|nr:xylulose 5-phosphate 3-epimerase [Craterilacuibacter sp. RT1T]MCL6262822.1 xylulose 5-phosphate 3-epimerase [Craterilacuibacter sp. RT1T]
MVMDKEARQFQGEREAAQYRAADADFAAWARGVGPVVHGSASQLAVYQLAGRLLAAGKVNSRAAVYAQLHAADVLACAGMWLVAHMTYARRVYLDGRALDIADFKLQPEGHTGGSLNMVLAYLGYMAANALTGHTRAWLMGQGHCVAAIDACNVLLDNMSPAHAARYAVSEAGLSRLASDFYSYQPDCPLGSHVNAHTAGGLIEGGYLGFAELQYVHMPLPGERLVAFLSDGAFEEQRGSDWMSRWWRGGDSGLVVPVMIANGRRIDQKTSMGRPDGVDWFCRHLALNGFAPMLIDGRDPAAFACAILEAEDRLEATAEAVAAGRAVLPLPLPYIVAETVKGWGFPGAGTNAAHNLPLCGNPSLDAAARAEFHAGAAMLYQRLPAIQDARAALSGHARQGRVRERDNALACRDVPIPQCPLPALESGGASSPMDALDGAFCALIEANPGLRVRVGNPDEMRSNHLCRTLDKLKHRVLAPEAGIAEAQDGCVITALNEEAVVCAALANKGGLSLVASYEAFAVKMLGAIRQEVIFTRHLRAAGRAPRWLSVPVISTSHTWENGKNEQSHQDTTLAEALLGEMADSCRVLFPFDAATAVAALLSCYRSHGRVCNLVVPKRVQPQHLDMAGAEQALAQGWVRIPHGGEQSQDVQLLAIGAAQLNEMLAVSAVLVRHGVAHEVIALIEPARLRAARDAPEAAYCLKAEACEQAFPAGSVRLLLSHTRPEVMSGILWPLARRARVWHALGYINQGGTLDEEGMLHANRASRHHVLACLSGALGRQLDA